MPTLDQLQCFVAAADQGSFSAASRRLRKAQSAVSTAVINLEIAVGVELFDRRERSPRLTAAGNALLEYARSVLQGQQEFMAHATSLSEAPETQLCVALEQGIFVHSLLSIFDELSRQFPFLEVELLDPGTNDVAGLLKEGRADIGVMMEQEGYPQGFFFRGIGYCRLIPVCARAHPLAACTQVSHGDLRRYRQLMTRSRSLEDASHLREQKSPKLWFGESPYIIMELLTSGLGWAVLPHTVVAEKLNSGELVRLRYGFQQTDSLQGVDLVWTERRALGSAGQWLLNKLLALEPELWSG
jgi:DNA-binding transcriptional LysR family regulator